MSGGFPRVEILIVLLLYSFGAHGIMTLNDFKAVEGDRQMEIKSLPVTLGIPTAARLACAVMALPQVIVVALLLDWNLPIHSAIVAAFLLGQCALMPRLLRDPAKNTPWYSGTGVTLYVFGMLAAAFGIGSLA